MVASVKQGLYFGVEILVGYLIMILSLISFDWGYNFSILIAQKEKTL